MKVVVFVCLVVLVVIGCSRNSNTAERGATGPVSDSRESSTSNPPPEIEAFFRNRGYEIRPVALSPTEWEKEQFDTQRVTVLFLRSRHQVPGLDANTYFRFRLIAEKYETPADAKNRLERLFDQPPREPNSEPQKEFPLRRGFAAESTVYTLATDVNAFMPELEILVKELERAIK